MMQRRVLVVLALVVMAGLSMQISEAWARAGGGGSRGSRSYSSPARPSPVSPSNPSSPSTVRTQPTSPTMAQRPGGMFGGGLMGGIAGFALGGLLGSMLFGGVGGGLSGGIGMFDILLIGGGLFLLYRFMRSRRDAQQPAYATAGSAYGAGAPASSTGIGGTATMEMPGVSDLDRGLTHIRLMDPAFDVAAVAQLGRETFTSVQSAVMANNMAPVAGRLTSRMYTELQNQCDRLRATRQTNRLERIDVQRADVTEAWQESGQDFVTVYLEGSLLDYTVDDGNGRVVAGSNTVAEPFQEFWTFVRPVGPNAWKLSAIQPG